ncbi:sigma-54-dependent Fis family transcriptional regulator [Sulfitobacter mediterraneus]|jgi:DNA-binding NtrC family response regulator|uniref:sigma-54-dependent transcriptional regulator n=1 Tax=Sulfitobacter mediterraneus TaxID=83219 RepID=UPI000EA0E3D9|nr:sigma-54 dependent transcriptional regulator [Sulfitobacter mediterraneus]MBM1555917.1 sigma-54-dependent Fis family transcriptional regulator [Sulfitobacter mediterraneus]MBM1568045.1 sigma-54-dependent Fis family transcriptional regulator [Sulfitobacter mediterraneus]MBM1571271.1 sigma-54-dependent Fis family transcriptional regulator [Sulfitobacter mediterraneus]MBM1575059.1 sigma-54-dependent Fis family transcriptional regulator [Sulfitobacter mediterraneus]MBM1579450.1 sigma-54-depende
MKSADTDEYGESLAHASILVIDDEPGMRNFLMKILKPRCKRVEQAASTAEATALLDRSFFDLVILDNIMPGKTGLDWVREQRNVGLFSDTILITAYADLETAIKAVRTGVADFVLKPFRANQILNAAARALDRQNLRRENFLLKHELAGEGSHARGRLLGNSAAISEVRDILERLAPLPTSVLFTGATGTGKEVAARTLHSLSDRADKPFVAVNCAVISPDRIAQELFGLVDNQDRRSDGLFLHAEGGTLFLDEVVQMPEQVQAALLRVLEEQRIRPVGAEREIPLNLRFLFATNADLDQAVAEGRFRADLYHRINVMKVEMPPLRDRAGDISELAALFLRQFSKTLGLPAIELDEETLLKFARYDWPGNVRELRNLIERSVILGTFPDKFAGGGQITGTRAIESLDLVMQRHIMHILDECEGNRAEAARRLGVSRKTVDRKCAAWGV